MCDPVSLGVLTFASSAASTVAGYVAQSQEAKATRANAEQSWRDQQTQISQREMQEQDALRQKQTQQNIQEAQAIADTQVSGAAAGISGVSLDNLLQDVNRRASTNRQVEETNTDMILSQLRQQRKATTTQAVGRISAAASPSPLSLIAGLGSSGVSGYNSYVSAKNRQL
ncbi:virion core protein, T7 gp14 family [Rhizobium rhizogenes]